jgi:hypothetical protein
MFKNHNFYSHYVNGQLHGINIIWKDKEKTKIKNVYFYYKERCLSRRELKRIKLADPEYCQLITKLNTDYNISCNHTTIAKPCCIVM